MYVSTDEHLRPALLGQRVDLKRESNIENMTNKNNITLQKFKLSATAFLRTIFYF